MPAHAAVFFAAPPLLGTPAPPSYGLFTRLSCLGLLTNVSMAAGPNVSAALQNPSCRFESRRRGLAAACAQDQSTRRGFFHVLAITGSSRLLREAAIDFVSQPAP